MASEATCSKVENAQTVENLTTLSTATAKRPSVSKQVPRRKSPEENKVSSKNYIIQNEEWKCKTCSVFCNSCNQFSAHMLIHEAEECDINNNKIETQEDGGKKRIVIAKSQGIKIEDFLNDKKNPKFQEFGFMCQKCDVYMTGEIQLVMHVKGAKHNDTVIRKNKKKTNCEHKPPRVVIQQQQYYQQPQPQPQQHHQQVQTSPQYSAIQYTQVINHAQPPNFAYTVPSTPPQNNPVVLFVRTPTQSYYNIAAQIQPPCILPYH